MKKGFSFVGLKLGVGGGGGERGNFHWGKSKSQNTDFLVQKLKHLSW